MTKKILCIFGTRPEAIKMAPVIMSLKEKNIDTVVVSTGQHKEMLDEVLEIFTIKPDYDLAIMTPNQTLFDITNNILNNINTIFETEKPSLILVHGDTTTAFVSALAAFYLKIPVAHIESGLRTFDKYNPFPEEMNRQLIDRLCDYYFCPTIQNKKNLLKENIRNNIFVTGNTVIDAIKFIANKNIPFQNELLQKIDFSKKTILFTCHRREILGDKMENIFITIKKIITDFPDIQLIYPIHLNPTIQDLANKVLVHPRIFLTKPLSYTDMVNLMQYCNFVITDSGGLQEEAPTFHKPVLVIRDETERQEGIKAGTLKLISTNPKNIYKEISNLLKNKNNYKKFTNSINPYGSGNSAKKITEIIQKL